MEPPIHPELIRYFDTAIDRIREHPSYGSAMQRAAESGETLVLDYHTHGPGHGWCASVSVQEGGGIAMLGIGGPLQELAHLRGIGREEHECEPLMSAFAARLQARYGLAGTPVIYKNGEPFRRAADSAEETGA